MKEDFFIGYKNRFPAKVILIGFLFVVIFLTLSFLLSSRQNDFEPGVYEYQNWQSFTGIISEHPYPSLLIEREGIIEDPSIRFSEYLLTVFGKKGADDRISGLDGKTVKIEAALIYKNDQQMLELSEKEIEVIKPEALDNLHVYQDLGQSRLTGEIVDSKCHYGVMRPGEGVLHRACAINCIRGGVPPVFVVLNTENHASYYWLTDQNGDPINQKILDKIGKRVQISGKQIRRGSQLLFQADPDSIMILN